jgi:hypothetical protein
VAVSDARDAKELAKTLSEKLKHILENKLK